MLRDFTKKEINSPSGIPMVFRASRTAFYEKVTWVMDKNSSMILNVKVFFSP